MSGKVAGFIVARAMAVLTGLYAISSLGAWLTWSLLQTRTRGYPGSPVVPGFAIPVIYAILAVGLWQGAHHFGPPDELEADEPPIDTRSAVGVATVAVALFVLVTHLPGFFNFLWITLDPETNRTYDMRPQFWADVASAIASGIALAVGWSNIWAFRQMRQGGDE